MIHELLANDPLLAATRAAEHLRCVTKLGTHDIALVLGSGWGDAVGSIGCTEHAVAMVDVPDFRKPNVPGHGGEIRSISAGSHRILAFLGRTHLNDKLGVNATAHAVRTAHQMGCTTVILTNGAGSLNPFWLPGFVAVIMDHDNQTGVSPLGPAEFICMNDAYSPRLWQTCFDLRRDLGRAVYVQVPGPEYETPAQIRRIRAQYAQSFGSMYEDPRKSGLLVGMSTGIETITARALDMEVLGLSLVTNLAAGMSPLPLNHKEVLDTGHAHAPELGRLLADILERM